MQPQVPGEGALAERIVANQVEFYLAEHPEAADTLEGICMWWIPSAPESVVQAALDDLTRRGLVRKQDIPGGGSVYSRATG